MATKKKSKKKQKKLKKSASTKVARARKLGRKSATSQRKVAKRKAAKKKPIPKKLAAKKKAATKKPAAAKAAKAPKKRVRGQDDSSNVAAFPRPGRGADAAGQSGDLQGLSIREDVDSESVTELIEEGNAFEADVVKGVEDADNADESEVHTHEVPEDDVPEEYLDKD